MKNDPVKIAKYQKEIAEHLGMSLDNLVFDYREGSFNRTELPQDLDLITVNPVHKQSFLFHSAYGYDKVDVLKEMLKYIKKHIQKESTFTVQWSEVESNELNTSYFSAHDMKHVLEKFSFQKDMSKIVIFSIKLNPIS